MLRFVSLEKHELLLALALGLAAGPVLLMAGPHRFFSWYAAMLLVAGQPALPPELRPGQPLGMVLKAALKKALVWTAALTAAAQVSLGVVIAWAVLATHRGMP
jgi:hypothetical protein